MHAGLGASPPRPPSSALHSLGAPAERREEGGPAATGRCGAGSEWGACRAGQMLCPLTAATPGGAWEDPPPRAPLLLRGRRCLRHGLRVTAPRVLEVLEAAPLRVPTFQSRRESFRRGSGAKGLPGLIQEMSTFVFVGPAPGFSGKLHLVFTRVKVTRRNLFKARAPFLTRAHIAHRLHGKK